MLSATPCAAFPSLVNVLLSLRRNLSLGPVVSDRPIRVLLGLACPSILECLGWLVSWGGIRSDYGRT
jgi:hypothetical protein